MRRRIDDPRFPIQRDPGISAWMKAGIRLVGHALRFLVVDFVFAAVSEAIFATFGNPILWMI